jgi:hypothetical protein
LEKTKSINIDGRTITFATLEVNESSRVDPRQKLATLEVNIMVQDLPGKNKQHNPDRDHHQDPSQRIF